MPHTMTALGNMKATDKVQFKAWNGAKGIYMRIGVATNDPKNPEERSWYFRGSLRRPPLKAESIEMVLGLCKLRSMTSEFLETESGRLRGLCKKGVDPRGQITPEPQEKIATLDEAFADYMAKREPVAEETRKGDKGHWERKVGGFKIGPGKDDTLGKLPVNQVTIKHIENVFDAMLHIPVSSNRVYRIIRAFWKFAKRRHPLPMDNPLEGRKEYEEDPDERILSEEELVKLGAAWRATTYLQRWNVLFLLYTGARVGILIKRDPVWLNAAKTMFTIPKGFEGVKRARTIYLSPRAADIIPKLRSCTRSGVRNCCLLLAKKAGIDPFSSHDCRGTLISLGVNMGYSVDDMMLLTSHAQSKIVRAYVKRSDAALVAITTKVSERMAELLGINPAPLNSVKTQATASPTQSNGLQAGVKVTVENLTGFPRQG